MASKAGEKDPDIDMKFHGSIKEYSFYGLLHHLENSRQTLAKIGHLGPPSKEPARLRPSVSLSFPEADLESLEWVELEGRKIPRVTTTFLGLYGVTSPIPSFYSEEILEDVLDSPEGEEPATREFLDIIHHRLLSLLYRCWKKYRYIYQKDPIEIDPVTRQLMCIIGLDPEGLHERPRTAVRVLALSGILSQHPRSASGLEAFLRGIFQEVPIEVRQCTPTWLDIPEDQRTSLGQACSRLGSETVIGRRILSAGNHFTLSVGPLSREKFLEFLPDKPGFSIMVGMTRFFVGIALEFTLELWLAREETGPISLGKRDMGRLGWDTWLLSGQSDRDLSVRLRAPVQKEFDLW